MIQQLMTANRFIPLATDDPDDSDPDIEPTGMLHRKNLRGCVSRLVSGTSALLTFPASWASKIVPCFLGKGAVPSFSCPLRVFEGLQREAADQVLQAVKFTDKKL